MKGDFRVCPACGTRNKPKWDFCARCGESLQGVPLGEVAPAEAARRARQEFGAICLVKEECREVKGIPMFDEFVRNVSFAFRQLRRSPGFGATVVVTLGLCIGANTAVFSVVDALVLRPLPYRDSGRLVMVWDQLIKLNLDQFPPPFANY